MLFIFWLLFQRFSLLYLLFKSIESIDNLRKMKIRTDKNLHMAGVSFSGITSQTSRKVTVSNN